MKRLAVILFLISAVTSYVYGSWIYRYAFYENSEAFYVDDYKHSQEFRNEFDALLLDVIRAFSYYKSEGNIEDGGAVSSEDLLKSFKAYYGVVDGIITSSTEVINDVLVPIKPIPNSLKANYDEYKELVDTKLAGYRKAYIQKQIDDYNNIIMELKKYCNFLYYVEDSNGAFIAGNMPKDEILALKQHIIVQDEYVTDKMGVYSPYFANYTDSALYKSGGKVYAGVPDVLESIYEYDNLQQYSSSMQNIGEIAALSSEAAVPEDFELFKDVSVITVKGKEIEALQAEEEAESEAKNVLDVLANSGELGITITPSDAENMEESPLPADEASPKIPDYEDNFYQRENQFYSIKYSATSYIFVFMGSLIAMALLGVYLIRVAGVSEHGGEVSYHFMDFVYNDIHIIMSLFSEAIVVVAFFGVLYNYLTASGEYFEYVMFFIDMVLAVAMVTIPLGLCCSISRHVKAKRFLSHTLCASIVRKAAQFFGGKSFAGWMVFLMLAYGGINSVLALIMVFTVSRYDMWILFIAAGFFMLAFNILSLALFIRAVSSLCRIMEASKDISGGNLAVKLDTDRISPTFLGFAKDINSIQEGFKMAVDKAVKNERMRAELITNVSHDLKTPLTSIITYVDLIKNENLQNENVKSYVKVLDEKSARLKTLIEDLIEASKASTGNLSVNHGRVNLRQLVIQACGEYEEKIEASGLDFRIGDGDGADVYADGKHMWRIVENLITNAIKYSMPNSRVYIDIIKTDSVGMLTVKNISAMPITIDPERLTDRFVRGDEARTTDGSGLGLSIAKSLSTLQNGEFTITLDGDLFKACVKMPVWKDEYEAEAVSVEEK